MTTIADPAIRPARNRLDPNRRVGAQLRELLLDPAWVSSAAPADLRDAVHAFAWRPNRDLIDSVAASDALRDRITPVARQVKTELSGRIADSEGIRRATLRRRIRAVDDLLAAVRAATPETVRAARAVSRHAQRESLATNAAVDLAREMIAHRDRVGVHSRDADRRLWRALSSVRVPHGDGTVTVGELATIIDTARAVDRGPDESGRG